MPKQNWESVRADYERVTRDLTVYSVSKDGEPIARIVVKYGGRSSPHGLTVRAFVHVLGLPMVRGMARGGGYDMKTAAIADAMKHLTYNRRSDSYESAIADTCQAFRALSDGGYDIPHQLRELGFHVAEVV